MNDRDTEEDSLLGGSEYNRGTERNGEEQKKCNEEKNGTGCRREK